MISAFSAATKLIVDLPRREYRLQIGDTWEVTRIQRPDLAAEVARILEHAGVPAEFIFTQISQPISQPTPKKGRPPKMAKPTALTIKHNGELEILNRIDAGLHTDVHGKTIEYLLHANLVYQDDVGVALTTAGISRMVALRNGDTPSAIVSTTPADITIHDDPKPQQADPDDLRNAARQIIRSHLHKTASSLVPLFDALTRSR